jgi:hypothetical protein
VPEDTKNLIEEIADVPEYCPIVQRYCSPFVGDELFAHNPIKGLTPV